MMYVDVIPSIRAIRGVDSFTYAWDVAEQMPEIGDVVWIPWRNHKILGLIIGTNVEQPKKQDGSPVSIKSIIDSVDIRFSSEYVDFIQWFATYYHLPLSTALHAVLPKLPVRYQRALGSTDQLHTKDKQVSALRLSKEEVEAVVACVDTLKSVDNSQRIVPIVYQSQAQLAALVRGLISAKHMALAVAEQSTVRSILSSLAGLPMIELSTVRNSSQWYTLLHALVVKAASFSLIGTRKMTTLPLDTFDTLAIVDPESSATKQWDQQPRYDAFALLRQQAERANKQIFVFTQALPLRVLHAAQEAAVFTPFVDISTEVRIIDIRGEMLRSERSNLSSLIVERLQESSVSVVWINRKGEAHWVVCGNCKWISGETSVDSCGNCRGLDLHVRGFGTDTVISYLRSILPEADIVEVTADSSTVLPKRDVNKRTIYVGTSALQARIYWPDVEYTAVLSADQQISRPDYNAVEEAYTQLVHLRNVTDRLDIQTVHPDHPIFPALQEVYPEQWLKQELQQRINLDLPPSRDRILAWHPKTDAIDEHVVIHDLSELNKPEYAELTNIDRQL